MNNLWRPIEYRCEKCLFELFKINYSSNFMLVKCQRCGYKYEMDIEQFQKNSQKKIELIKDMRGLSVRAHNTFKKIAWRLKIETVNELADRFDNDELWNMRGFGGRTRYELAKYLFDNGYGEKYEDKM